MLQKIAPADAQLGMFVTSFGGGWFDHPFWKKRFLLEDPKDLQRVRECGLPFVEIDTRRGLAAAELTLASCEAQKTDAPRKSGARRRGAAGRAIDPISPAERQTRAIVAASADKMRGIFDELEVGWRVDFGTVEDVLSDIEREIEKDAEMLLKVVRLKTKDDYTYLHSIAVCAMMVCVARHRGLNEQEMHRYGQAGLLHDIGKVAIANTILKKRGRLTDDEFRSVRKHPEAGYELLKSLPDVPEAALDVCLHHHEKIDGSGYPYGLAENEISQIARLGAVCDVFDALTSHRAYKEPWSRQKALTAMWSWEGHFDRAVLAEFMQVMHVYADGLLVRLANGALALVREVRLSANYVKVTEFYSAETRKCTVPRTHSIKAKDSDNAVVSIEDPANWGIDDWEAVRERIVANPGQTLNLNSMMSPSLTTYSLPS